MGPLLSHMRVNMAGLNQGRVPGGGDANRASHFGFQVILESQGLLAFVVVFLKVRTKGDQSCSPLIQAKTQTRSSPRPPTHNSVLIRSLLHVLGLGAAFTMVLSWWGWEGRTLHSKGG